MEMNQLRQEQQMLERERQQLLQDKEQFQMHIHEQMEQMEAARAVSKEQQETAYEWTELLWDQSFHLAEKS